jgi:hypothetical protein
VAHHKEFLRKVMKGCLLSRRIRVLRILMDLKALALRFAQLSAKLKVDTDAFDLDYADPVSGGVGF